MPWCARSPHPARWMARQSRWGSPVPCCASFDHGLMVYGAQLEVHLGKFRSSKQCTSTTFDSSHAAVRFPSISLRNAPPPRGIKLSSAAFLTGWVPKMMPTFPPLRFFACAYVPNLPSSFMASTDFSVKGTSGPFCHPHRPHETQMGFSAGLEGVSHRPTRRQDPSATRRG